MTDCVCAYLTLLLMRIYENRGYEMGRFGRVVTAIAVVLTVGVAGCQKNNDPLSKVFDADRYFSNLKTEKFVIKKAQALDVDAVIAALPDDWVVEYASTNFDVASGATILKGVTFAAAKKPEIGVRVKELSIWGADTAVIVARIQGKQIDQAVPMAARIEASDLDLYGLETLIQPLMDKANVFIADIAKNDPNISDIDLTTSFDTYDFTMGKIIITNLVLYPSVLKFIDMPADTRNTDIDLSDEEVLKIVHWFQKAANISTMISYDDFATYDSVFDLTMTQYGQPTELSGKIELTGYKAVHRGNVGYAVTKNISYDMTMPISPLNQQGDTPTQSLKMHTTTERSVYKDIRLAKAMDHLARGVMPDRTDTDFMSFGVWKIENTIAKFDGAKLYSLGSMTFDMSEFYWLIPEIIDIRFENIKYNIAGFINYMETSLSTLSSTDAEALGIYEGLSEKMEKIVKVLEKYDLEEPSLDFGFGVKWDGVTGESAVNYDVGIDDFTRYGMKLRAELPSYDAILDILIDNSKNVDEEAKNAALETLFRGATKLKEYTIQIKDEGGFDKGFAMVKDFAALAPENNRTAFLQLSTPEQLREMVAAALVLGASSAQADFPPAMDYMQSAADFVREGGELTMFMIPPMPLGVDELESIEELFQTATPDETVKKLGVSVVHKR